MEDFVSDYKKIDTEVRQRISSDMVKVIGLDNLLYGTIHALVCECINSNIPREERRKFITDRVNVELDRWID